MQTSVEIGSAVRKIFPDKKKKNKQIENISRVAQLTLGARLKILAVLTIPREQKPVDWMSGMPFIIIIIIIILIVIINVIVIVIISKLE